MSCEVCGAEDWACSHEIGCAGPYCEACGVVPAPGKACMYFTRGGRAEPCEPVSDDTKVPDV